MSRRRYRGYSFFDSEEDGEADEDGVPYDRYIASNGPGDVPRYKRIAPQFELNIRLLILPYIQDFDEMARYRRTRALPPFSHYFYHWFLSISRAVPTALIPALSTAISTIIAKITATSFETSTDTTTTRFTNPFGPCADADTTILYTATSL
jgi:hypothetical protein